MKQKDYKMEIVKSLIKGESPIREIARNLGTNHMIILRKIKELLDSNVVDFVREGKNKKYFLKKSPEARAFFIMVENYLKEDKKSNNSTVFKTLINSCFFNNFSSVHNGQLNFNANARYGVSFVCSGNNSSTLDKNSSNPSFGISSILSLKTDNTSKNSVSVLCVLANNSSLLLVNSSRINSGAINFMLLDKNISLDNLFPFINNENNSLASITTNIYLPLLDNLFDSASLTSLPNLNASFSVNSLPFEKDSSILSCTTFFSNASLATSDQFIILNSDNSFFNSSEIAIVKFAIFSEFMCNHVYSHIFKSLDSGDFSINLGKMLDRIIKEKTSSVLLKNHTKHYQNKIEHEILNFSGGENEN